MLIVLEKENEKTVMQMIYEKTMLQNKGLIQKGSHKIL